MIKNLANEFGTSEQMVYYFAAGFVAFIILLIIFGTIASKRAEQRRAEEEAEFEASIAGFAPEKQVELRLLRQGVLAQEATAKAAQQAAWAEQEQASASQQTAYNTNPVNRY